MAEEGNSLGIRCFEAGRHHCRTSAEAEHALPAAVFPAAERASLAQVLQKGRAR